MRDFRDAKAIAQTLRDALKAKSVSLTHSESLELVAKALGFYDWHVLAARIQSERQLAGTEHRMPMPAASSRTGPVPDYVDNSGKSVRQEVAVDATILDGYVGFYQLADNAVMTVTRNESQLVTRLTGQRTVPIYPQSNTEFFAKIVDAQISFITDARRQAESLVLHQHGRNVPMKRIDATMAQKIEAEIAEKLKRQSASPGTDAALRRLVDGIIRGKPNYDEMSSELAQATREQWLDLQSNVAQLGAVQSIQFLGVGRQGEDVYIVQQEHGPSHWRIALDSGGTISMAFVTRGL
jgi:glyoxalase superfamily protein/uncharacterized protein DUF3471